MYLPCFSQKSDDIDIGVRGISPRLFFKFYAELFKHLSKHVDLADISKKSLFNELVEETRSESLTANLSKQIFAEKENVEIALSNLKEAMARKEKSVVELAFG
ncbi:MAG: hypothetical protein QME68_04090 [Elusimicrobiota bacterium]|nr:hypothetical protein [Elusimicrobiota bacterium]